MKYLEVCYGLKEDSLNWVKERWWRRVDWGGGVGVGGMFMVR